MTLNYEKCLKCGISNKYCEEGRCVDPKVWKKFLEDFESVENNQKISSEDI